MSWVSRWGTVEIRKKLLYDHTNTAVHQMQRCCIKPASSQDPQFNSGEDTRVKNLNLRVSKQPEFTIPGQAATPGAVPAGPPQEASNRCRA